MGDLQQQLKAGLVETHFSLDLAQVSADTFVDEVEGSDTWQKAVSVRQKFQSLYNCTVACRF